MLEKIIQGFSVAGAAKAFGVQNSLASEVLDRKPLTADEYLVRGGARPDKNLSETANPKSMKGGVNRWLTTVPEIQTYKMTSVNDRIRQKTNTVSFAVQNTTDTPFDRQGDLSQLAGQTGRKLDTSA